MGLVNNFIKLFDISNLKPVLILTFPGQRRLYDKKE